MIDLDIFKNWDEIINKHDFRKYTCKKCGEPVATHTSWVRGETLCRRCFEKLR